MEKPGNHIVHFVESEMRNTNIDAMTD